MAPIATLAVKLQAQIAEFQGEFKEAQKEVQKFHDNFQTTATKASAFGNLIAIGAEHAVRAIGNLGREILESASNIKDLASRTGLAVETIQRFQYVAEQTGTTVDSFADAAFRLSANIAGGGKGVVAAVEELGLSFADLKAQSPDKQFEIVADALGKMENAGERNRLGMLLMQRTFKEIAPAIAEGYKQMADEAEVAGRRQIDALDGAGDAVARFQHNSKTLLTNFAGTVITRFEELEAALDKFDARFGALRLLLPGNTAAFADFAKELINVRIAAGDIDLSKVIEDMQRIALMKLKPLGGIIAEEFVTGTADYRAVEDKLNDSIRERARVLKQAEDARRRETEEIRRQADSLIGLDLVEKALQTTKAFALNESRGLLALEDAQRAEINERLGEAILVYRRLGREAPAELRRVYDATFDLKDLTMTLPPVVEGLTEAFGRAVKLPNIEDLFPTAGIKLPEINVGISSLPGFHITKIDIPEIKDTFLQSVFGADFGRDLGTIIGNVFRGGSVLDAVSQSAGLIGSSLLDGLAKKLTTGANAITGWLGGLIQTALPAVGALLGPLVDKVFDAFDRNKGRDLVEDFAASFGGFDDLQKRLMELGDEGGRLWIKLTQGVGRNNPEQAAAAIAEVQAALDAFGTEAERTDRRLAALGVALDGVNEKATLFAAPFQALIDKQKEGKLTQDEFTASLAALGEKGQAEFERIGTFAAAAFAGIVNETGDAIGALDRLSPALAVLKRGVDEFGLSSTGTIDALIGLFDLVHDQTTGPILQAIQATGQIFAGLQDAGILTSDLFQTVSDDIGAAFRELEAKGGDVAKAMALSQPVLQRLWEAQQTYGKVTDETTQKILDQAHQQGLVGDHMKDVNKQILDVLIAIADVFGAKIPDAMRKTQDASSVTARRIEDDFKNIHVDPIRIPIEWWETNDLPTRDRNPHIPEFASGGIVRKPMLALVGEVPEAIIPLNQLASVTPDAGNTTVVLQMDGRDFAEVIVPHFPGAVRRHITV